MLENFSSIFFLRIECRIHTDVVSFLPFRISCPPRRSIVCASSCKPLAKDYTRKLFMPAHQTSGEYSKLEAMKDLQRMLRENFNFQLPNESEIIPFRKTISNLAISTVPVIFSSLCSYNASLLFFLAP